MADDESRGVHLSDKQLVFVFMAGTVAAVVFFLFGVLVGRGVQQARGPIADGGMAAATEVVPDGASGEPSVADDAPRSGSGGLGGDQLSYPERLGKTPPAEQLKPPPPEVPAEPLAQPRVAVLAEPDPVEVQIADRDLKLQTYRASGAGGQNVQKVETAVRITHLPSGITVTCEDERSQHQNKLKALRVLRAKLLEQLTSQQEQERAQDRRTQVGSAQRSEKIRTYNFPQDRITDHRIARNFHNLPQILDGDLSAITQALHDHARAQQMEQLSRP